MGAEASIAVEPAVEIRPGVFRPDWSVVTRTAARQALRGQMTARAGLLDRWSHRLEAVEDLIWRTILRLYADHGQAPKLSEIAAKTGVAPDRVAIMLHKLQSHDLIDLDQASKHIRLAYPFTEVATGHRVELKGHTLHALCAIDALGCRRHVRRGHHDLFAVSSLRSDDTCRDNGGRAGAAKCHSGQYGRLVRLCL